MSQLSAAASLLWAVLSVLLLCFMVYHLYHFDGFQCLSLKPSRQQGAFKRMLTYGYVLSVPLLVVFSVGLASLKYRYGYTLYAEDTIVPTPTDLWPNPSRGYLKALYIILSVAWALEMVSHLEELNFWLFLLTTTSDARPWLRSPYFLVWCLGSVVALAGMPVTASLFAELDKTEAYIFLVGASGSGLITLASLRVVFIFPHFIRKVKCEGAEATIVSRLQKYYELNNIRVFSRFLFFVPSLLIGAQGIRSLGQPRPISWAMDFLAILSGIGVAVSSAITLLVFFPRISPAESGAQPHAHRNKAQNYGAGSMTELPYQGRRISAARRSRSARTPRMHNIDFPEPALAKGSSNALGLGLGFEIDLEMSPTETHESWKTHGRKQSSCSSFEYEITVERYDDAGQLLRASRAVEDLPYEAMRLAGLRYSESGRSRSQLHLPTIGDTPPQYPMLSSLPPQDFSDLTALSTSLMARLNT